MIEREIPKDVRKYKKKFVGPLSMRQTLCTAPGVALGMLTYWGVSKIFEGDAKIIATLLVVFPFIAFGWIEVYKMPLEKFLKVAFNSMFISPHNRLYKTSCASILSEPAQKTKPQKKKKAKTSSAYPLYK